MDPSENTSRTDQPLVPFRPRIVGLSPEGTGRPAAEAHHPTAPKPYLAVKTRVWAKGLPPTTAAATPNVNQAGGPGAWPPQTPPWYVARGARSLGNPGCSQRG
eukprot:3611984-Pyramimonas_sp.AAC.1